MDGLDAHADVGEESDVLLNRPRVGFQIIKTVQDSIDLYRGKHVVLVRFFVQEFRDPSEPQFSGIFNHIHPPDYYTIPVRSCQY